MQHRPHRIIASRTRLNHRLVSFLVLLLASVPTFGTWSQFGGPNRDFALAASPTLADWGEHGPRVVWMRTLGPGYSGLVVAGDRLITMTRDGADEVFVALDPATGETQWRHAYSAPTEMLMAVDKSYGDAPQATPLVVGDRVIGLGFTGVLSSVDATDGSLVWRHNLTTELRASVPYFGHSASPIQVGDTVVVVAGGAAAFDLATGAKRWHNAEFDASYASPILVSEPDGEQLVAAVAGELVGLDPRDGTLLWRREHANRHRTFLSSPVAGGEASGDGGEVIFASAYFLGSLALRLGADGSVEELWQREDLQVSQSNALRLGSTIVASNNRQLVAVDLLSGEERWRQKGVGRVNMVALGERVLLLDERGRLSLARLDADGFERLASTRVLGGRSWTAPTVIGTRAVVRDQERVVALDLSTPARHAGETFAGLLDQELQKRGDRSAMVAPKAFLDAAEAIQSAAIRSDREVLGSADERFEPWQDHAELGALALYYRGFAAWILSLDGETGRQLAEVDRAVELLKQAVEQDPSLADAHALLSSLYGRYYRLAPGRAGVIGPLGDEHLVQALELEPDNPRVVAIHGLDLVHSPVRYGGDPERGKARLREALTAVDKAEPADGDPTPNWGAVTIRLWLAQVLAQAGDPATAQTLLREALERAPDDAQARRLLDSLTADAG